MSCTNEYWEFDYRTTFDSCGGNKHNYIPDISYNVSLIIEQHLIAVAGSPNPPCGPEDHVSGMYVRQVQHQHHHHLHKQHHPHHHHHKGGVNIRAVQCACIFASSPSSSHHHQHQLHYRHHIRGPPVWDMRQPSGKSSGYLFRPD